ncbi:MAG: asparagine synthase (glutamine-hydrolyzing) [Deltaproteobacteria bacterium]
MCGIAGIVNAKGAPERGLLTSMCSALAHRGPDDEGVFIDNTVGLGHRRLSILDLSSAGRQPMGYANGRYRITFNGEIYNYVEIRDEFKAQGLEFKSRTDTEVILAAYALLGEKCLDRLRGAFAFAIYDCLEKRVFLARDRLGEKPLYYMAAEDSFVFASELKSILQYLRLNGARTEIDLDAVNMYFHYQYVPEPYTCIKGILKLPAGHTLTLSAKDLCFVVRKYWDIEDIEPRQGAPASLIRECFDGLSGIIIRSDMPVGVSLSGGIDSSAIAAFAARHYKDNMHAFSIGYPGRPGCDERGKAEAFARSLGLKFHDTELSADALADEFEGMVYFMDDPIADIAAYGYFSVNRLARRHGVPVLLSGTGGDELFWGYEWVRGAVERNILKQKVTGKETADIGLSYLVEAFRETSKKQMLINPFAAIRGFLERAGKERAKFFKNPERFIFYDDTPNFSAASGFLSALSTDAFRQGVSAEKLFSFFTDDNWDRIPIKICKFLMQTWLFSNCVALNDRMGMAHGVETRLPFLDYKLIELVIGLRKASADDYRLGYKRWFVDAMKGIVPEEILEREKQGFTPPYEEWFKAIVKRFKGRCTQGVLVSSGIMRPEAMAVFLDSVLSDTLDTRRLFFAYKMVLLEVWLKRFTGGNANA